MKFNHDIDYISRITQLDKARILDLLKYFGELPLQGKIEAFYIGKLIEGDDEFAFHEHHFDKNKAAEYEFALVLLGIDRIYSFDNKDVSEKKLSSYKLNLISKIKELKEKGDS